MEVRTNGFPLVGNSPSSSSSAKPSWLSTTDFVETTAGNATNAITRVTVDVGSIVEDSNNSKLEVGTPVSCPGSYSSNNAAEEYHLANFDNNITKEEGTHNDRRTSPARQKYLQRRKYLATHKRLVRHRSTATNNSASAMFFRPSFRQLRDWLVLVIFASITFTAWGLIDPNNPCAHENDPNVGTAVEMPEGTMVYTEIPENKTHRYFYANYNVSVFNQQDSYRNLIINLEPCKGVVYIFVRKTRKCYPNPYSCIDVSKGSGGVSQPKDCEWTHFMSVIDGTRDGAPTFFELPLTSTKYYISVFAKEKSRYTLTLLSDIGAYPRPGNGGQLQAMQLQELQVQLSWDVATFYPEGISEVSFYHVYSAALLDTDKRTNSAIFLSKSKIMNTVCGLKNNTDRPFGDAVAASRCHDGRCNATIDGVIVGKRYVFNVVAQSARNFNMSYAGLILQTDWQVVRKAASDNTLKVLGAVTASVLGMVVMLYVWMINLYGK